MAYRGGPASGPADCKVYVGDLGNSASKHELEDAFGYYGPLRNVWVARNPPGFAFVEFEDPRDADDAVRGLDNRTVCGRRARVEMASGRSRSKYDDRGGYGGRPGGGGRTFNTNDRCYECGERGHYAYDCRQRVGNSGGYGRPRRSRSASGGRRYSRSRSPRRYSRSRTPQKNYSRSRSRSNDRY